MTARLATTALTLALTLPLIAACGDDLTPATGDGADLPSGVFPDTEPDVSPGSDTDTADPSADVGPEDGGVRGGDASPGDAPAGDVSPGDAPDGAPPADVGPPPECLDDGDCDDGDPCTVNLCEADACVVEAAAPDTACDDGDPCTEGDVCGDEGTCGGEPIDCDDGNGCTVDLCKDGECLNPLADAPECVPSIHIDAPPRGTILSATPDDPTVAVVGHVVSPASPVDSVVFGEATLPVSEDGTFETTVAGHVGLNVLEASFVDAFDQDAVTRSTFLMGEGLHPVALDGTPTPLTDVAGMWLSDSVFDDDDTSDLDDLATLASVVIEGFDLESALPDPLLSGDQKPSTLWCEWDVSLSNVAFVIGNVDLWPQPGGLYLAADLSNLSADVDAIAPDFACPDAIGTVDAETVAITAQVNVDVVGGSVLLEVVQVDVQISEPAVDITGGAAVIVGWLVDWFVEDLADIVAEQVEAFLPTELVPILEDLLAQFTTFETSFELPSPLDGGPNVTLAIALGLVDAAWSNPGAVFDLAVGVSAPKAASMDSVLDGGVAGSIARGTCLGADPGAGGTQPPGTPGPDSCVGACGGPSPSGSCYCDEACVGYGDCCADYGAACLDTLGLAAPLPQESAAEIAFHEDIANQVLSALWVGGYLKLTIDGALFGEALEGTGLEDLVVSVTPLAPPVVTSCTESGGLELGLGDARLEATFSAFGLAGSFTGYAGLRVAVELGTGKTEEGLPGLELEDAELLEVIVDIRETEGLGGLGGGVLELLIDQTLVPLLADELLAGFLAAYPLPTVDLASLSDLFPTGSVLAVAPDALELVHGFVLLGGAIEDAGTTP